MSVGKQEYDQCKPIEPAFHDAELIARLQDDVKRLQTEVGERDTAMQERRELARKLEAAAAENARLVAILSMYRQRHDELWAAQAPYWRGDSSQCPCAVCLKARGLDSSAV